jgi:hypothetical protein
VKTEASQKPVPIDPYVAEDLLAWYRISKYASPEDYVFATDAARAGSKRGKQPLWLAKVMQYHIQPFNQLPKGSGSGSKSRGIPFGTPIQRSCTPTEKT